MAKYGRKQELQSANYRVYEARTYTHCDLTELEIFENFQQKNWGKLLFIVQHSANWG